MSSHSAVSGRARPVRVRSRGRGVVLLVFGALTDICGVINVPGAAVLPASDDGRVSVTDLGTLLVFLAVGAWLTVLWRAKHPLIVLIAGGVLAVVGLSYLLLLVGAVVVARQHPTRLRLIGMVVGGVVVLYVVREVLTPWGAALPWFFTSRESAHDELAWVVVTVAVAVIGLAATSAIVLISRARRRAELSDVRAQQQQQRAEVLTEQMVRQAERDRIARDMHDALAHRLSVVSLHAGALEAAAAGGDGAGDIARTVREQTHAALQDMRGLIGDLRSGPGESSPSTLHAISALLADLRRGGVPITAYVVVESPERASAQFESAVYRIVQESLTNAIKHARGAAVDVFLRVEPTGGARIRIENPLVLGGSPVVPGGGNGSVGIRERTAALGGTAWIGAHEGVFIVDVTLPWQERV